SRRAFHLPSNEQPVLPRVSVDLDFLEDDVILGGSPGGSGSNTMEPCDILQQSLAEANITEQSLAEAEAELDLGSFDLTMPGLTQVVQTLPCTDSLTGPGGTAVGVGLPIFPEAPGSSATPPQATADMLDSVLAQQGLEFGPQVMNKAQAISMQPFMQQVAGLGNVTLQPISSLQALPNGCQSGHLGLGQIQVMGQPTVMTMNQSGQPILAKAMGGYQLHQPGPEAQGAGGQGVLGGGLLIQGGKATLGSPVLNGPALCTNSNSSTITATGSLGQQGQNHPQGQVMQNLIIQRTPTPIQPKPPQGGAAIQPKLFKQQQAQPHTLQNDANKALGAQVPVSAAQNVAFLTGKPGSNVVLTSQAGVPQQALFKQQTAHHPSGKALSVHLLNQPGSIMLGGQNHQFLLPQQLAGGQIVTQHPGGHIITSRGPGGQLIANQILAQHQNINLGQVLTSQGHPLLQGHIQLQPGQMGVGHQLFQMPVTLSQSQTHPVTGHQAHTVIQGMPLHNSLAMLSQVEGLSPAVSLQPALQPQPGGVPSSGVGGAASIAQGQPGGSVPMLGSSTDQAAHPGQAPQHSSILSMQAVPSVSMAMSVPSSSPMILSQEQLQMFLQQVSIPPRSLSASPRSLSLCLSPLALSLPLPSLSLALSLPLPARSLSAGGQQQQLKLQSLSPSQPLASHTALPLSDSPQPSPLPMHSPQSWPPSQPQTPARSCTPSSLPPMFIIQNQIPGPSQPAPQQQQIHLQPRPPSQPAPQQQQIHLQPRPPSQPAPQQQQIHLQPRPPSQPALYQPDVPPPSRSPKPPQSLQFTASQVGDPGGGVVKTQVLTADHLQNTLLTAQMMLEQLRKQQGSVLHPDYSSSFQCFEDTLTRLVPYHLYQGTATAPHDYHRVDDEFERVSSQLLKRTQAMLDKYRHLLFEESTRLGPSAEMVMMDRMFIQEEKISLGQDRILARDRPEEYVANSRMMEVESGAPSTVRSGVAPAPAPTPIPAHFPSTKLVIKQGGAGASVSWSSSPAPVDDDPLPRRTSKPPMKTYAARPRIGLKLKIKQEAGFSKVVHNTALDPVHTPSTPHPTTRPQPAPAHPTTRPQPAPAHPTTRPQPAPALPKAQTATTCRLPLRKTYRENISPRVRPGVPGGGGDSVPYPRGGDTFRMDQHAPGPPSSPPDTSCYRDSSLPAKRCKSDSPVMDNASFSSGSPPHDESLNEHLQCAIDTILNLQGQAQGPTPRRAKGGSGRPHHHSQRPAAPQPSSHAYRPSVSSSSSSSLAHHSQVGGRGLVPQTHSR
uniref:BRD4 interacting chromatin remodeling complex associated protein n=1 Tax=Salmo trutta TaxID=8032 RepID=A0A673WYV7_SALTR